MARKKTADKTVQTESITFRAPVEVKRGLEDLAHLSRCDMTDLLVELCTSLVDANKARITKFRQQVAKPIKMPTFDTVKKKTVNQQVQQVVDTDTLSDEGGGSDEND